MTESGSESGQDKRSKQRFHIKQMSTFRGQKTLQISEETNIDERTK